MVLNKIFKATTDFDQILKLEKSRKSGFKEFFLYFFRVKNRFARVIPLTHLSLFSSFHMCILQKVESWSIIIS